MASSAFRLTKTPQTGSRPAGTARIPASNASTAARDAAIRRRKPGSAPNASSERCSGRDSASPNAIAMPVTLIANSSTSAIEEQPEPLALLARWHVAELGERVGISTGDWRACARSASVTGWSYRTTNG